MLHSYFPSVMSLEFDLLNSERVIDREIRRDCLLLPWPVWLHNGCEARKSECRDGHDKVTHRDIEKVTARKKAESDTTKPCSHDESPELGAEENENAGNNLDDSRNLHENVRAKR